MAYDEQLAQRIRLGLARHGAEFTSKDMMGGHLFLVDGKMLCGIHIDKRYGDSLLMVRIGEESYITELERPECLPMDFTGRPMKGYIYVIPEGFARDKDLDHWIRLALAFNPRAQASRTKRRP